MTTVHFDYVQRLWSSSYRLLRSYTNLPTYTFTLQLNAVTCNSSVNEDDENVIQIIDKPTANLSLIDILLEFHSERPYALHICGRKHADM